MAKIKIIFIQIILSCMLLMSCTSDITYRLGNGYVYHNEGGSLKRIFCTRAKCNIYIPPTILSYSYDNTFILAKQNPKFPRLAIEPDYSYNFDGSSLLIELNTLPGGIDLMNDFRTPQIIERIIFSEF